MQVLALKRTHIGPRVLPPGEAGGGGGAVPETPETIGGRRVRPRPAMPGEVADQSTLSATTTASSCTATIDNARSSTLEGCGGMRRSGHGQGWVRAGRAVQCAVRRGRHHGPRAHRLRGARVPPKRPERARYVTVTCIADACSGPCTLCACEGRCWSWCHPPVQWDVLRTLRWAAVAQYYCSTAYGVPGARLL